MKSRFLLRSLAGLAAASASPLSFAAAGSGSVGGVLLKLPLLIGAAIGAHLLISLAAKWLVGVTSPLATGEEEAVRYQRSVYGTAERETLEIVILVLVSGLLMWLGATFAPSWVGAVGAGLVVAAVVLDMMRWERAAASANFVWFQRGLKRKVHQIAIENIRDVAVHEEEVEGFTVLHGKNNRICRVHLKMQDKHIVALPRTDAPRGLDGVEALANHVRARLLLLGERKSIERAERDSDLAPLAAEPTLTPEERAMRHELKRLRRKARDGQAPEVERRGTPQTEPDADH
ncbi:MAG: hypothetical protein ABL900_08145 [Burkholderiaceae bacterium]